MLCSPLSPSSLSNSSKVRMNEGLISGLSGLSCKSSSEIPSVESKIAPSLTHQSNTHSSTPLSSSTKPSNAPKANDSTKSHSYGSDLYTSTPNSKIARGILSTLEQYAQPEEFLYCMGIMINILSCEISTLIPEELVSEMVYYLSLFNNILTQALHSPSPKQFLEQPRIYRQIEYFTSILWRMVDALHILYFPQLSFPKPPVNILDEEAFEFWKSNLQSANSQPGVIIDSDAFILSIKQHFDENNQSGGVVIDECVRQELMAFLDPIDCGVITSFKFMAFANFFRPFKDCIQNMHQFHNCLWFRGYVSYPEGQQILASQPRGAFLLHFPQHCPWPLALTCEAQNGPSSSTLIDKYSPMLLSTEGIRLKWCKDVQIPCEINFAWNRAFFGLMTFEEAEELLSLQPTGTYLLRLSHSSPGWFVIAYVSPTRKVLQLKVAVKPNGFESGKKHFATLSEVINSYSTFLKNVSFLSKFQQDTRIVQVKMKKLLANHDKELMPPPLFKNNSVCCV